MCIDEQVVCAGSLDTFQIFVWSVKTARLLDVLAAHEGPVVALAFSPTQPLLASASWDKTVRTWDVFRSVADYLLWTHPSAQRSTSLLFCRRTSPQSCSTLRKSTALPALAGGSILVLVARTPA